MTAADVDAVEAAHLEQHRPTGDPVTAVITAILARLAAAGITPDAVHHVNHRATGEAGYLLTATATFEVVDGDPVEVRHLTPAGDLVATRYCQPEAGVSLVADAVAATIPKDHRP